MSQNIFFPDWRELVVYPEKGAQPKVLVETDQYKSVIAGLSVGSGMPPHPEGPAIFHFLEGSGQMMVGENSFTVDAGATVIVPDGDLRGIEAKTRLAFLAVRLPQ